MKRRISNHAEPAAERPEEGGHVPEPPQGVAKRALTRVAEESGNRDSRPGLVGKGSLQAKPFGARDEIVVAPVKHVHG